MKINHLSPVPIYEQLAMQIIQLIVSGELRAGEALPSVRRLAKQTGVSNNTIVKAYNELEKRGFIKTYGNKGVFVLEQGSIDSRHPFYKELTATIGELFKEGIKPHIIRRMLENIITEQENKHKNSQDESY